MHLTAQEERILNGEEGEGAQKAMEILVALGEINNADRLIKIASAQVSGVSYKTIGDAGAEFLRDWSSKKAKVKVLTTLNPAGVDLEMWKELGYPKDFADRQLEIIEAYGNFGIMPSCTCTPYLIGNVPKFGEHVSWAESSSAIFANSVLGARTNRESGISALASAIIGKTARYGMHLTENRAAALVVDVEAELKDQADYAALGYYIGKHYGGTPLFRNIKPSSDDLKALGAALAVGQISMFHVESITPEHVLAEPGVEKVSFEKEDLKESFDSLNTCEEPDIICIGCPHCSVSEINNIIKLNARKEVWVFTARQNKRFIKSRKNVKIISDTCMVVSPLEKLGISSIGTNSAKAAFYSANLSGLKVKFDSAENLMRQ